MKILGWVLVVCGAVGGVGRVMGQAAVGGDAHTGVGGKRAMTFADLMAMKRVSDPQVSASGKWVLFSVTEVDLERNTKVNHLWVVGLGGGGSADAGPSASLRSAQDDKQRGGNAGPSTAIGAKNAQISAQDDSLKGGTAGPSTAAGASSAPAFAQDDNLRGGAGGRDGEGKERQLTFGQGETFGRFSPDGKWISYSEGGRIVLAPWDEGAGRAGLVRVLVASVAGGADGAVWSPDSKRLMFVGEVWPECSKKTSWAEEDACDKAKDAAAEASPVKGEVWDHLLYRHWDQYTGEKRSHVLVVNVDGSGVRDLTPAGVVGDAEVPTFSLGGPLGYAWAPDSKEVAYVANLDAVPAASTNNDVFTLRLDEVGAKAVKVSTSVGSDDGPAYSPDGKWLAFRSQERAGFESDRFRLVLLDREKKTIKELMPKFDNWVDEFVWAPDSKAVYFASGSSGAENIYDYSLTDNSVSMRTNGVRGFDGSEDSQIFRSENDLAEFSDVQLSADGKTLVASMMTMRAPNELVALEVDDREEVDDTETHLPRHAFDGSTYAGKIRDVLFHVQRITRLNDADLNQLDLKPLESFWFVGAEGTKVQGFVLRPPGFVEGKKYPVKFVMHGGPQTALGDSWSYRWNWELMAASGYVVVGINRRGSTGYGQRFIDEVSGDWGGRAYEDLMKGLDYAEGHFPFIDKTRECALGASYGGFMADWVLTHTDRFKCIVTHDGMVDPVGAYGSTEELWFNEWEFRRPEDFPKGWDGFLSGYDPTGEAGSLENDKLKSGQGQQQRRNAGVLRFAQNDTGAEGNDTGAEGHGDGHAAEPWRYAGLTAEEDPFRRWSPMRFIERAKTPTLVIHSQKDYRLDVSQGLELFTGLQRLGVPSKMLYFPDEGHWVLKPQNSQLWYDEVGDWCDRWTKTGRYAEK